ncbi:MAG: carbohydrate ABC transporter permease [Promethearchaeota archaeon]
MLNEIKKEVKTIGIEEDSFLRSPMKSITKNWDYLSLFLMLFSFILIVVGFWETETILWNRIKYTTGAGSQWQSANPIYLTYPLSQLISLLINNMIFYILGNFLFLVIAVIIIYRYLSKRSWVKTSKILIGIMALFSLVASVLGFWLRYSLIILERLPPLGGTSSGYEWIRVDIGLESAIIDMTSLLFLITSLIICIFSISIFLRHRHQIRSRENDPGIIMDKEGQLILMKKENEIESNKPSNKITTKKSFSIISKLLVFISIILIIWNIFSFTHIYLFIVPIIILVLIVISGILEKKFLKTVPLYFILILYLFFTLFPVFLAVIASISTPFEINHGSIPRDPIGSMIMNYSSVMFTVGVDEPAFINALTNSLFIGFGTSFFGLVLSVTSAYALARFKFRGKAFMTFIILSTQMFPAIILLIPQYVIMSSLGFLERPVVLLGLLLVMATGSTAYVTWMMKGYFETIPVDIEEAAYIDGYGKLSTFIKIVIPLAKSGMIAVMVFTFLSAWQEFVLARTFIGETDPRATLPLLFFNYQNLNAPDNPTFYELLSPYSILVAAPVIIFYLLLQRQLVSGVVAGGVK